MFALAATPPPGTAAVPVIFLLTCLGLAAGKVPGLKLDRTLLPALHQHPGAPALLSAALHMAAATGLEVTACGVETATQHAWLRQQGCTAAQGSLCGRHDDPWPHAAAPCAIRLAA